MLSYSRFRLYRLEIMRRKCFLTSAFVFSVSGQVVGIIPRLARSLHLQYSRWVWNAIRYQRWHLKTPLGWSKKLRVLVKSNGSSRSIHPFFKTREKFPPFFLLFFFFFDLINRFQLTEMQAQRHRYCLVIVHLLSCSPLLSLHLFVCMKIYARQSNCFIDINIRPLHIYILHLWHCFSINDNC